ncbi:DNA polymerase III subunit beta [Psychrobacillus sp. FSL K6-4046]|uniref:DNA polymerase III subunit beta n=1 Tax=Psychrobacillus sp. FSL K6-4046 TaxID=2921550 RepID=UPI003159C903
MEFIIDSACFNKAISEVNRAVSLKTPFPILSGIKITVDHNHLTLVGSNSDIIIEKVIPVWKDEVEVLEVCHTGSIVVAAQLLSEILKKLPGKIHIKVNEEKHVTIQANEIVTTLYGFNADEYPSLPQMEETESIKILSDELVEIIKQTVYAASKNESRPVLTGVNMSFHQNRLTCIATNSQRLALRELTIDSVMNGSFNVPATSLSELSNLITKESSVINIFVSERYIVFKSNTISLFSKLIDGNYPNVSGLLSNNFRTTIILNTVQLLKAIDRACLFASEWKNNNVQLEINNGAKIKISSNSTEIGKIEETLSIKAITGDTNLTISLDAIFLMDALKIIKEEEIKVSFNGSMSPILIEPIEQSSYLQLISPVRSY